MTIAGQLPPSVPDDAAIVARIITDAGKPASSRLAVSPAHDGRFELQLPTTIDTSLLEEERMGCDEEDTLRLAYLPYLLVERQGEIIGRLVLTDMPRQLWRYGTPAKHAYVLYAAEAFAAEGECGPGSVRVSFEVGWNPLLVIADEDGMRLTSESAPDSFGWRYDPQD